MDAKWTPTGHQNQHRNNMIEFTRFGVRLPSHSGKFSSVERRMADLTKDQATPGGALARFSLQFPNVAQGPG